MQFFPSVKFFEAFVQKLVLWTTGINLRGKFFPSEARPKAERSGEFGWSKKKMNKKKRNHDYDDYDDQFCTRSNILPFFLNFHTYVPSIHSKKYLWSLLRTNSLQKTSWRNLLWEKKFFWRKTWIFRKQFFRKKKNSKIFFSKKKIRNVFFFRKNILNFFFFEKMFFDFNFKNNRLR